MRYVDDTWVTIITQEVEAFSEHIKSVDYKNKFTRDDPKEKAFLDCSAAGGAQELQQ